MKRIFLVLLFALCILYPLHTPKDVYAATHPTLILNQKTLNQALLHSKKGKTAATYQALSRNPSNVDQAIEAAFVYHIGKASGVNDQALISRSTNILLSTIRDVNNAPETLSKYPVEYMWGWNAVPVILLYDWTYNNLSPSEQTEVRNYLYRWEKILLGYMNPNTIYLSNNHYTPPAAALWMIEMVTEGEPGSNPLAKQNALNLARRFRETFLQYGIFPSGVVSEGVWYQHLSMPIVSIFLAAADEAGQIDGSSPAIVNLFDWLLYFTTKPGEMVVYGDAGLDGASKPMWSQYAYFLFRSNKPQHWWTWDYLHPENVPITWNKDAWGGKTLFVIYYDPDHPTFDGNFGNEWSKFFPDRPNTTTGGLVSMRNGFTNESAVLTLLNENIIHVHQHYHPNSISYSYGGERFIVDLMKNPYSSTKHGEDKEQNQVVVDGGGMPSINQTYNSDSQSTLGIIPVFLSKGKNSLVVSDAKYPLADLSKYPDNVGYDDIIPFVSAQRTVLFLGDYWQAPLSVVMDKYQKDTASHRYTQLWHTEKETVLTGTGSLANPWRLTRNGYSLWMFPGNSKSFLPEEKYTWGTDSYERLLKMETTGVSADFTTILVANKGQTISGEATQLGGLSGEIITNTAENGKVYVLRNPNRQQFLYNNIKTDSEIILLVLNNGIPVQGFFGNYKTLLFNDSPAPSQSGQNNYSIVSIGTKISGRHTGNSWQATDWSLDSPTFGMIGDIKDDKTVNASDMMFVLTHWGETGYNSSTILTILNNWSK